MTARDPSKPPGRCNRADRGGRTYRFSDEQVIGAIQEAGGNITRAAAILEREDLRRSDARDLAARKRKKLPPETDEEREERRRACRVDRRSIHYRIAHSEVLQEARLAELAYVEHFAEDTLIQAMSGRVTATGLPTSQALRASMFYLDRRSARYRRKLDLNAQLPPVSEPLDLGGLPEEEQRRLAEDDEAEPT